MFWLHLRRLTPTFLKMSTIINRTNFQAARSPRLVFHKKAAPGGHHERARFRDIQRAPLQRIYLETLGKIRYVNLK